MNLFQELEERIARYPKELWEKECGLKRNEYLKKSGTVDTNLYFIKSGLLQILLETEEDDITFRFAYEGNIISALDSFLTGNASDFAIKAIKKSEVKVMRKDLFDEFLASSSENLQLWQKILSLVIIEMGEREKDLLLYSPEKRYQRVLERSPVLFQLVPAKYIASYLRMTPETLSRIRKS
ncbi:MAG: hypothetical protein RL266_64 [Bacteroidota bacterium]